MRKWIVFCGVLAAACGGDDDDNGGSGGSRLISTLNASEAQELCEAALSEISDTEWRGVARLACAFGEVLEEECSNTRIDICVDETVAALKADPAQCDEVSDSESELQGCTVTVSELNGCLDDVIESISDVGAGLTCENFGTAELSPELPASCQSIRSACPGLIDLE